MPAVLDPAIPSHAEAYAALDTRARSLLRRHKLGERERLVAEIVLDWSYAKGRPFAQIPQQNYFSLLTGISKGNISQILRSLARANILLIDHAADPLPTYTFNVDAAAWRYVDTRLRDADALARADAIEAHLDRIASTSPEQLHLIEPLPDLARLLADDAREQALHSSTTHTSRHPSSFHTHGGRHAAHPGSRAAGEHPEIPSGSRPSAEPDVTSLTDLRRRIADSLGCDIPPEVPESGTEGHDPLPGSQTPSSGTAHIKHLDASNSSHLMVSSKCAAVPDSGTELVGDERDRLSQRDSLQGAEVGRPTHQPSLSPLSGASRQAAERVDRGGGATPRASGRAGERELLDELAAVLGTEAMKTHGGYWRLRIRENRRAVVEALADLRLRLLDRHQPPVRNRGGWLRDRYRRIHAG